MSPFAWENRNKELSLTLIKDFFLLKDGKIQEEIWICGEYVILRRQKQSRLTGTKIQPPWDISMEHPLPQKHTVICS